MAAMIRSVMLGIVTSSTLSVRAVRRLPAVGLLYPLIPIIRILVIGVDGGLALAWISAVFFQLPG